MKHVDRKYIFLSIDSLISRYLLNLWKGIISWLFNQLFDRRYNIKIFAELKCTCILLDVPGNNSVDKLIEKKSISLTQRGGAAIDAPSSGRRNTLKRLLMQNNVAVLS